MTKQIRFWFVIAVFAMVLAACHGPMLGIVTETYVNQKDAVQTLELTSKETLKGFLVAKSPNPLGGFTLFNQAKATSGTFVRVKDDYILKSEDKEFKITMQKDSTLLDENGNSWKLQNRSRTFRAGDEAQGKALVSLKSH